jgi:hypothetical protein
MDWLALIKSLTPADKDLPEWTIRLLNLQRVLYNKQYDHFGYCFDDETEGSGGEYVPLKERRPSVRTGLCRVVVDDATSLLFSEGHVAILFRVLKRKPFFSVIETPFLTPEWDRADPDRLLRVTEKYKVDAKTLRDMGYDVNEDDGQHWFRRIWDEQAETWYHPWPVSKEDYVPRVDKERTVIHGLGFTPLIWVKNLPGGNGIDGACTFEPAIDTVIEGDYLLSQAGRALKYASDPRLVVRDSTGADKTLTGGAANVLVISDPQGDAKLLEINGNSANASIAFVSCGPRC